MMLTFFLSHSLNHVCFLLVSWGIIKQHKQSGVVNGPRHQAGGNWKGRSEGISWELPIGNQKLEERNNVEIESMTVALTSLFHRTSRLEFKSLGLESCFPFLFLISFSVWIFLLCLSSYLFVTLLLKPFPVCLEISFFFFLISFYWYLHLNRSSLIINFPWFLELFSHFNSMPFKRRPGERSQTLLCSSD